MISFLKKSAFIWLLLPCSLFAQQATLNGTITDANSGEALIGANARLLQSGGAQVTGAATDADGKFSIKAPAGAYTLTVSYTGYETKSLPVTLRAGQTESIRVGLTEQGIELDQVVVSASRQAEKVLDAPASVTVLNTRDIQAATGPTITAALRNVEGVDAAQTGIGHFELVLRGFNNAFSGAAYTLVDYRQSGVPSLNLNSQSMMPISNIDVERIEVVRGPGSALYGPGVDSGVIHFITKNPFEHKGTTISLGGGQNKTGIGLLRHAGTIGNKFGYKINGRFTTAEDFYMDPTNYLDYVQLNTNSDGLVVVPDPANTSNLLAYQASTDGGTITNVTSSYSQAQLQSLRDVPRERETIYRNVNGMVEYRFKPGVSLIGNAGISNARGAFQSGIGNLQADGFGYSYGQLRFQANNFFISASLNKNAAGNSYVYGNRKLGADGNPLMGQEGIVVDKSAKWNLQAQYDWAASTKLRVIAGTDFQYTQPNTEGTIYGRNEIVNGVDQNLHISEYGAYAQAQYDLSKKIELTLAARGDYNNIIDKFNISPRFAAVYKVKPGHTLRATFNNAFSSPTNNSLFLDIPARVTTLSLTGIPTVIRARGSVSGFTFPTNAAYPNGGFVATGVQPWNLGQPVPAQLRHQDVYGYLLSGLLPSTASASDWARVLENRLNRPANSITNQQATDIRNALVATQPDDVIGAIYLNPLTRNPMDVNNVPKLDQTTTQTYEIGYKGILKNKLLLAVDAYYTKKKNFVGPLLIEAPLVLANGFSTTDLTNDILSAYNGSTTLVNALNAVGATPTQMASGVVGTSLNNFNGRMPVGIVAPVENANAAGQMPELMLAYRNFGNLSLWGTDFSFRYIANKSLTIFGNTSYVSDNFFDENDLKVQGTGLYVAYNAPQFKFKLGTDYTHSSGFSGNIAFRWSEAFPVASGPYVGGIPCIGTCSPTVTDDVGVEQLSVLDLGAGYQFKGSLNGMRLDVSMNNALDAKVREFYGAPAVRRYATARLTYTF